MARRKEPASETYVTTTAAAKKTPSKKDPDDFSEAYIRLRTVLDGLEISALRYCLENKNTKYRIKRADEIVKLLLPMVKRFQDEMVSPGGGDPGGCEDGFYLCNGCCVPYPCPGK